MRGALIEMSSMLGLLIGESKEDFLSMAAAEAGPSFRSRPDGGFDYFPDGTSRRGYRIDSPTRDRIMRIRRGLDGLFFGLIAILVLASFVMRPALHGTYTLLGMLVAGGAIGGVVLVVAKRGARRMIRDLLRGAPAVGGLSEAERRALLVRRWREVPRWRLFLTLLGLIALAIVFTATAAGQDLRDAPLVPDLVIIGLAVLAWAAILQLAFELIRLWRWSRALR
jgi:hypothetical protein